MLDFLQAGRVVDEVGERVWFLGLVDVLSQVRPVGCGAQGVGSFGGGIGAVTISKQPLAPACLVVVADGFSAEPCGDIVVTPTSVAGACEEASQERLRLVVLHRHEFESSCAADTAVLFEEEIFCGGAEFGAGKVDVSVEHHADDVFAEQAFLDDTSE